MQTVHAHLTCKGKYCQVFTTDICNDFAHLQALQCWLCLPLIACKCKVPFSCESATLHQDLLGNNSKLHVGYSWLSFFSGTLSKLNTNYDVPIQQDLKTMVCLGKLFLKCKVKCSGLLSLTRVQILTEWIWRVRWILYYTFRHIF